MLASHNAFEKPLSIQDPPSGTAFSGSVFSIFQLERLEFKEATVNNFSGGRHHFKRQLIQLQILLAMH